MDVFRWRIQRRQELQELSVRSSSSSSSSLPGETHRHSIAHAPEELASPPSSCASSVAGVSKGKLADVLGNATRHGVSPGPRGTTFAKVNQDRGVAHWPFNSSSNEALFCVFDGHGVGGEKVAEQCMRSLPYGLLQEGLRLRADPAATIVRAVLQMDTEILKRRGGRFATTCGTTATIVYLNGTTLWSACVGDSRAVMGYGANGAICARDLTVDCKPDMPEESERIRKAGGLVTAGVPGGRPSRVWADGKVGLAMSRSIGDGECKKYGVIADPLIARFEIEPASSPDGDGDRFLIVASDGVWEFLSSQEACEIVASEPESATKGCAKLVQAAAQRWKRSEGNYRDDITAIVARLPFTRHSELQMPSGRSRRSSLDMYINAGLKGMSELPESELSEEPTGSGELADTGGGGGGGSGGCGGGGERSSASLGEEDRVSDSFASRRLTVARLDDCWSVASRESAERGASAGDLEEKSEDVPTATEASASA